MLLRRPVPRVLVQSPLINRHAVRKCRRGDSNPYTFRYWLLRPARLPIPPLLRSVWSIRRADSGDVNLTPKRRCVRLPIDDEPRIQTDRTHDHDRHTAASGGGVPDRALAVPHGGAVGDHSYVRDLADLS